MATACCRFTIGSTSARRAARSPTISPPVPFCTFDYRAFCQGLLAQCARASSARGVTGFADGAVTTSEGRFTAPVVVDCFGLARRGRAATARPTPPAAAYSFGLETHTPLADEGLWFLLDQKLIRHGPRLDLPRGRGQPDRARLVRRRLQAQARRSIASCADHGVAPGYLPRHVLPEPAAAGATVGRVFAVGDAGGQCLPLTAEGIRPALYFGSECGKHRAAGPRRRARRLERRSPHTRRLVERYRGAYREPRGSQWFAAHAPTRWFAALTRWRRDRRSCRTGGRVTAGSDGLDPALRRRHRDHDGRPRARSWGPSRRCDGRADRAVPLGIIAGGRSRSSSGYCAWLVAHRRPVRTASSPGSTRTSTSSSRRSTSGASSRPCSSSCCRPCRSSCRRSPARPPAFSAATSSARRSGLHLLDHRAHARARWPPSRSAGGSAPTSCRNLVSKETWDGSASSWRRRARSSASSIYPHPRAAEGHRLLPLRHQPDAALGVRAWCRASGACPGTWVLSAQGAHTGHGQLHLRGR